MSTAVQITSPEVEIDVKIDLSFGSDLSLTALPGSDATVTACRTG